MSPGDYPRPDVSPPREHPGDRTFGSIVVVFSLLGLFLTLPRRSLRAPFDSLQVVELLGAALLFARLVGGWGVLSGRRWGFLVVALLSIVNALLHILGLANAGSFQGIFALLVSVWIAQYCVMRLLGRNEPAPT